jgi:hypothetical protein
MVRQKTTKERIQRRRQSPPVYTIQDLESLGKENCKVSGMDCMSYTQSRLPEG